VRELPEHWSIIFLNGPVGNANLWIECFTNRKHVKWVYLPSKSRAYVAKAFIPCQLSKFDEAGYVRGAFPVRVSPIWQPYFQAQPLHAECCISIAPKGIMAVLLGKETIMYGNISLTKEVPRTVENLPTLIYTLRYHRQIRYGEYGHGTLHIK
jgi:hypothetical protein